MPPPPGPERPPNWGNHPPPPGYIAPSPYASAPYGWASNTREHDNGTTILVLGILSLVVCGLLGPVAWAMGSRAIREMDAQPGVVWSNRGNVTAGRICGIISSCLLMAAVAFVLLFIVAAVAGNS